MRIILNLNLNESEHVISFLISSSSSMYVDVQIHSYQVEDEHVRVIHTYSNQSYSKGKKIILQSIIPVTRFRWNFLALLQKQ